MTRDYIAASDKALAFLEKNVARPEFRAAGHDDVAYYMKAPAAFLAAGKMLEARAAWQNLAPYLATGGRDSANEAYALQYPMYPWFWMARAAAGPGEAEALRSAQGSIQEYVHPALEGAVVKRPFADEGNTVDFFSHGRGRPGRGDRRSHRSFGEGREAGKNPAALPRPSGPDRGPLPAAHG